MLVQRKPLFARFVQRAAVARQRLGQRHGPGLGVLAPAVPRGRVLRVGVGGAQALGQLLHHGHAGFVDRAVEVGAQEFVRPVVRLAQVGAHHAAHDHRAVGLHLAGLLVFVGIAIVAIAVLTVHGPVRREFIARGQSVQPRLRVGQQVQRQRHDAVQRFQVFEVVGQRRVEERARGPAVLAHAAAPQRCAGRVEQGHLLPVVVGAPGDGPFAVDEGQLPVAREKRHQRRVRRVRHHPAVAIGQRLQQVLGRGHEAALGVQQAPVRRGGGTAAGGGGACHGIAALGRKIRAVAQRRGGQRRAVRHEEARAVVAVGGHAARHARREVAPALDHHLAAFIEVAVAVVPGVGFVEEGQALGVEGVDARVARLQHPVALGVDEAVEVSVQRGRGRGRLAEGPRVAKARLDHPAARAVHEAVGAFVAGLLPQRGARQAVGTESAQLMKDLVAGGAAGAVDDAPGILPHLHRAQAVAKRLGIVEGGRDDDRAGQVDEAPAPAIAKARQAVFGKATGVVQRGRHAPAALTVDIAPQPVGGPGRADPSSAAVGPETQHLGQALGRHHRPARVDDEHCQGLVAGFQRNAGQPRGCRFGVVVVAVAGHCWWGSLAGHPNDAYGCGR